MSQLSLTRQHLLRGAIILSLLSLGGCKIISVEELNKQTNLEDKFNADTYIESLWDDTILPYFERSPFPINDVISTMLNEPDKVGEKYGYRESAEGSKWVYMVSGAGTVLTKNTKSRAGKLLIQLRGLPNFPPVTLQIGPIVKGNDVRDALPFIKFKDFSNQLEFADVGKSLKIKVIAKFSPSLKDITDGTEVKFVGVFKFKKQSSKLLITPVLIEVR